MQVDLQLNRFQDNLSTKKSPSNQTLIFDPIRKKHLVLLPEELVRQLIIQYLLIEQKVSLRKIQVEKKLVINEMTKRYDIIIYDSNYQPFLLVECKTYKSPLKQSTFRQIASYNLALKVPYLMISNGLENYLCKMDYETNKFEFLDHFPPMG